MHDKATKIRNVGLILGIPTAIAVGVYFFQAQENLSQERLQLANERIGSLSEQLEIQEKFSYQNYVEDTESLLTWFTSEQERLNLEIEELKNQSTLNAKRIVDLKGQLSSLERMYTKSRTIIKSKLFVSNAPCSTWYKIDSLLSKADEIYLRQSRLSKNELAELADQLSASRDAVDPNVESSITIRGKIKIVDSLGMEVDAPLGVIRFLASSTYNRVESTLEIWRFIDYPNFEFQLPAYFFSSSHQRYWAEVEIHPDPWNNQKEGWWVEIPISRTDFTEFLELTVRFQE